METKGHNDLEDYGHLRCLSYPNTDVFLLCFSLVDPKSLDVCQTVWMPEIRKYAGDNVPVLLVGTKEDLLDSAREEDRVSFDTARRAASQVSANSFEIFYVRLAEGERFCILMRNQLSPFDIVCDRSHPLSKQITAAACGQGIC
ncbi:Ras family protein [Oesophagostomum dentatum]|uniref:Ras family protein n=1 Tax=Oesophagostomum dentatum TaxID=61180 RepID=A0A0B1TLG1_OESDE|nr:Ras family protein [Oesophagostomum dentatum]